MDNPNQRPMYDDYVESQLVAVDLFVSMLKKISKVIRIMKTKRENLIQRTTSIHIPELKAQEQVLDDILIGIHATDRLEDIVSHRSVEMRAMLGLSRNVANINKLESQIDLWQARKSMYSIQLYSSFCLEDYFDVKNNCVQFEENDYETRELIKAGILVMSNLDGVDIDERTARNILEEHPAFSISSRVMTTPVPEYEEHFHAATFEMVVKPNGRCTINTKRPSVGTIIVPATQKASLKRKVDDVA